MQMDVDVESRRQVILALMNPGQFAEIYFEAAQDKYLVAALGWLSSDFDQDLLLLSIFLDIFTSTAELLVPIGLRSFSLWPLVSHHSLHWRFFEFDVDFVLI